MNKQKYIQEITKLMEQCSDIDLLDLIYRLLYKSVTACSGERS